MIEEMIEVFVAHNVFTQEIFPSWPLEFKLRKSLFMHMSHIF